MKQCIICGFNKRVELHHIIKKAEGGSDENDNLVYLCPNHHWVADFGNYSDRQEILGLIKEITNKIGSKISNEEQKIVDLKIRALNEEHYKEAVYEEEWWNKFRDTSNYSSCMSWLLGRKCPIQFSRDLNEKAEKLMLIRKLKLSLPKT